MSRSAELFKQVDQKPLKEHVTGESSDMLCFLFSCGPNYFMNFCTPVLSFVYPAVFTCTV